MISVIYQHKLAIGTHMSPPSPSHPSKLSQSTSFGFPVSYGKFPLALCFTYGLIYVLGQQCLVSGLWPEAALFPVTSPAEGHAGFVIAFRALLGSPCSLLGPLSEAGLGMGDGHPDTTVVEL